MTAFVPALSPAAESPLDGESPFLRWVTLGEPGSLGQVPRVLAIPNKRAHAARGIYMHLDCTRCRSSREGAVVKTKSFTS
jgi:hypothetical protein